MQRARTATPTRGLTLIGLLSWAIVVGFAGYVLVHALPTVTEFYAIQRAVDRVAVGQSTTVAGIRAAFDKQKNVDQTISSISGSDLDITKQNDKVVISFAYEKEIELAGPVFLLLKYRGQSK